MKSSERNIKSFPHSTLWPKAAHTHRHFHLCTHSITLYSYTQIQLPQPITEELCNPLLPSSCPQPMISSPIGGSRPLLVLLLHLPEVIGISSNYHFFSLPFCAPFKFFLVCSNGGARMFSGCLFLQFVQINVEEFAQILPTRQVCSLVGQHHQVL